MPRGTAELRAWLAAPRKSRVGERGRMQLVRELADVGADLDQLILRPESSLFASAPRATLCLTRRGLRFAVVSC